MTQRRLAVATLADLEVGRILQFSTDFARVGSCGRVADFKAFNLLLMFVLAN